MCGGGGGAKSLSFAERGGGGAKSFEVVLSLYSTATQNHSRRVLELAYTPNATLSPWGYQHVGI